MKDIRRDRRERRELTLRDGRFAEKSTSLHFLTTFERIDIFQCGFFLSKADLIIFPTHCITFPQNQRKRVKNGSKVEILHF